MVFDDGVMVCEESSRSLEVRVIPVEVQRAYSRHIRYLSLSYTLPQGTLPTHLRQLHHSGEAMDANIDLLNSNPQLPDLFLEFGGNTNITAIQPALKTLTHLKVPMMN